MFFYPPNITDPTYIKQLTEVVLLPIQNVVGNEITILILHIVLEGEYLHFKKGLSDVLQA
jgi:hypothetical protein